MVLIMVFSVIFVLLSYLILAQTPNLQKNKNKNFFSPRPMFRTHPLPSRRYIAYNVSKPLIASQLSVFSIRWSNLVYKLNSYIMSISRSISSLTINKILITLPGFLHSPFNILKTKPYSPASVLYFFLRFPSFLKIKPNPNGDSINLTSFYTFNKFIHQYQFVEHFFYSLFFPSFTTNESLSHTQRKYFLNVSVCSYVNPPPPQVAFSFTPLISKRTLNANNINNRKISEQTKLVLFDVGAFGVIISKKSDSICNQGGGCVVILEPFMHLTACNDFYCCCGDSVWELEVGFSSVRLKYRDCVFFPGSPVRLVFFPYNCLPQKGLPSPLPPKFLPPMDYPING